MDKNEEKEVRGVNNSVDDQEIGSSNSVAVAGAPKVSTKKAPKKKPYITEEIILEGITLAQLIGIEEAYWAKNRGNQK